jgi:hypothetical protein
VRGASIANFGIEGYQQLIDLVWLWFRNLHDEIAAGMMRTSEPPESLDYFLQASYAAAM